MQRTGFLALQIHYSTKLSFHFLEVSGLFDEDAEENAMDNTPSTSSNVEVTLTVPGKKSKCGRPYVISFHIFKDFMFHHIASQTVLISLTVTSQSQVSRRNKEMDTAEDKPNKKGRTNCCAQG